MWFYFDNALWKVKTELLIFMETLLSSLIFYNAC